MSFQRARTEKQAADRQMEIINACDRIYEEEGFDGVTFKAISERTSFSRPSIYNYYNTKDEVMLDVLGREYRAWEETLSEWNRTHDNASREEYCRLITDSLHSREKLLKLLASNYSMIEKNCSQEKLTEFKLGMQPFFTAFNETLHKCFPDSTVEKKQNYFYLFFALIDGLYPLSHLTEKQVTAMKTAMPEYAAPEFYGTLYRGLLTLTAEL